MKRVLNTPERELYNYDVMSVAQQIILKVKAAEAPLVWFCLKEAVDKYGPMTDLASTSAALQLTDNHVYRSVAYNVKSAGLYVAKRMGIGGKNRTTVWRSREDFEAYIMQRIRLLATNPVKTAQRDHALQLRGEP